MEAVRVSLFERKYLGLLFTSTCGFKVVEFPLSEFAEANEFVASAKEYMAEAAVVMRCIFLAQLEERDLGALWFFGGGGFRSG